MSAFGSNTTTITQRQSKSNVLPIQLSQQPSAFKASSQSFTSLLALSIMIGDIYVDCYDSVYSEIDNFFYDLDFEDATEDNIKVALKLLFDINSF